MNRSAHRQRFRDNYSENNAETGDCTSEESGEDDDTFVPDETPAPGDRFKTIFQHAVLIYFNAVTLV